MINISKYSVQFKDSETFSWLSSWMRNGRREVAMEDDGWIFVLEDGIKDWIYNSNKNSIYFVNNIESSQYYWLTIK